MHAQLTFVESFLAARLRWEPLIPHWGLRAWPTPLQSGAERSVGRSHRYRDARLRSDSVLEQEARLAIYAEILRGYAIDRRPQYEALLKDPATLIVTDPLF